MKTTNFFAHMAFWVCVAYLKSAAPVEVLALQPKLSHALEGHGSSVSAAAFCRDGKMLATAGAAGSPRGGYEHTIILWDVKTWKKTVVFGQHSGTIGALAASPNGAKLASASLDKTIRLWDLITLQNTATFMGHDRGFYSLAFSPDGRTVAAGDNDQTVVVWEVATGKQRATVTWPNKISARWRGIHSLAFHPNGRFLAAAGPDRLIRILDIVSASLVGTMSGGQQEYVDCVAFSPDGKLLASCGVDARKPHKGQAGKGPRPVAVLADLTQPKALPESDVEIWDVRTAKRLMSLKGHHYCVNTIAFSPDGKTLASGGADCTVKLWDVATGRNTATLEGHSDYVRSVAFSPSGTTLLSGSADGALKVWDLQPASAK